MQQAQERMLVERIAYMLQKGIQSTAATFALPGLFVVPQIVPPSSINWLLDLANSGFNYRWQCGQ